MFHSSAVPALEAQSGQLSRVSRITRSVRETAGTARIFLVVAAIAFWLGGFTFYSGVAIPMGVEVLGGHRAVGFVTERVTNWLNVAGVVAIAIFAWNTWLGRRTNGRALQRTLMITLIVMALIEVELILLHPVMDRQLVFQPRRDILDEDKFELLHHVYLISTTVQWVFGMVHVWCICMMWRKLRSPVAGREIA
jgi:hypothetical protein